MTKEQQRAELVAQLQSAIRCGASLKEIRGLQSALDRLDGKK